MACTLVGVGLLMTWLERWHNEDDYGHVRRSLAPCASRALTPPSHTPSCAPRCPAQVLYTPLTHKVMHGVYYAFAGFASKTEEFTPKTAAGRVLALANAFAVFLAISFYIANLAAVFTNTAQPVQVRARAAACFACCARASSFAATPPPCGRPQLITTIDSFGEQGLPACIQNKARHGRAGRELGRAGHRRNGTTLTRRIPMCCGQSVYIQFVQSHYPSTQLVLVPEYPEARARGLGEKSGLRFPLAREGDPGGGAALARARARRTW